MLTIVGNAIIAKITDALNAFVPLEICIDNAMSATYSERIKIRPNTAKEIMFANILRLSAKIVLHKTPPKNEAMIPKNAVIAAIKKPP